MKLDRGHRAVAVLPSPIARWFAARDELAAFWVVPIEAVIVEQYEYDGETFLAATFAAFHSEAHGIDTSENIDGFFAVVEAKTEAEALKEAAARWALDHEAEKACFS